MVTILAVVILVLLVVGILAWPLIKQWIGLVRLELNTGRGLIAYRFAFTTTEG